MVVLNNKTNYIILQNSSQNHGLTIHTHANFITKITTNETNSDISLNAFFSERYPDKYKNRIILSQKTQSTGSNLQDNYCCFITQNNIKNNIKFIHDLSNANRKILFINNQDISDNSYNYLFNNIESVKKIFFLNYYFNNITNNKDYFRINIKDFIYNYAPDRFMITDISTTTLISTSISGSINYNSSDFTTLFVDNKTDITPITSYSDVSINKFNKDISYILNNNIYSYNKLTLDFTNINSYTFSLYNTGSDGPLNLYGNGNSVNTFNTFMIKTNNFAILNNIKATSKILVTKNDIFLHNVKTLDICSNFYINNTNYNKTSDLSKTTLFLSLGKQITGITQYDIYNNIHIIPKNRIVFDISKIIFKKNINSSLIRPNSVKYNTLVPDASNLYLLDFTFNSINSTSINRYVNSSNYNNIINYNNNIKYNNTLFNYVEYKNKKIFDINISKLIDFSNNQNNVNNYSNNVNNLLTINNKHPDYATISYEIFNSALKFKVKNIVYNNTIRVNNEDILLANLYTSNVEFDLRFNYEKTVYMKLYIDILLNNNILDLCNNYPFNYPLSDALYYSKLNFYNLQVVNLFTTTPGSDFENVDCIFIYHDPVTETDPRFLYPYNNIEIIKDPIIDTLEKAIVLLPGTRTSTTNSTFIPASNGSNLSRKMIQGLIGLNNVPKLLSIVPYDPNSIIGRGFVDQYQIDNLCNTYTDKLNNKINSIKHVSAKNNINSTNRLRATNFANVVRSNARNRLSQVCIDNLRENAVQRQNIIQNSPVVTPFRLFVRK